METSPSPRHSAPWWALLIVGFLCGLLIPMACGNASGPTVPAEADGTPSQQPQWTAPYVPAEMVFADEKVDLRRSDLHERMDRELITFTYGHTLTMLMLKRANRFFPIVEPILREEGIPDDLKYLMVIESNLVPTIKSPAGAMGLWQFMPATGREMGLEVNANIDERCHVEKATRAACRYLRKLHAQCGDWMTVCASYNAGPAGIASRSQTQKADNALDLLLVEETSRYMFRVMACKQIFEHPRLYGFHLAASDLYPCIAPAETVTVTATIDDLPTFARDHGCTFAQLIEANPWLRETSLQNKSGRTYKILIPDTAALNYDPTRTSAYHREWVE